MLPNGVIGRARTPLRAASRLKRSLRGVACQITDADLRLNLDRN